MKQLMSVLLVSVAATACVHLDGQFDVKQPLNTKIKTGFLNLQTKDMQIQPGIYDATVKSMSDKKLFLKIKPRGVDQKDILIPIKSKDDLNIPTAGEFELTAAEIDQPFNVLGSIKTDYSESSRQREIQSCTITRVERHCVEVSSLDRQPPTPGPTPRPQPRIVCTDVTISIPGEKVVEFHTIYTSRDVTANFVDPQTKDVLAELSSSGSESRRVTDYESPCYIDHHDPHHPHHF